MATRELVTDSRADSEARLVLGLALSCAIAFGAFVVLPAYASEVTVPSSLGALWMLGTIMSVVLGPLAAGLAGYASFVALWLHGGALPTSARRLHLVTIVVAVVFLALFMTVGADILAGWSD